MGLLFKWSYNQCFKGFKYRDKTYSFVIELDNVSSNDSFTQQGIVFLRNNINWRRCRGWRSEVHFPGFSFYFLWLFNEEEFFGYVHCFQISHFQKAYLVVEAFIILSFWWWTRFSFEYWLFIIHLATPRMKVSLDEEFS